MPENENMTIEQSKPTLAPKPDLLHQETHHDQKNTLNFVQRKIPRWVKAGAVSASLGLAVAISACGGGSAENHTMAADPTVSGVKVETPISGQPSQTAVTTVAETQTQESPITDPQTAIEKIKTFIETSKAPQDAKDQLEAELSQQEKAHNSLALLESAYEAQQTDGVPTLLAQTKKMFGSNGLRPLWEGEFSSEDDYLRDQIFFLHDKKVIDYTLLAAANLPNPQFTDIQTLIQRLPLQGLRATIENYANMNTESPKDVTFSPFLSENPSDQETYEKQKAEALKIIEDVGIDYAGNINIRIDTVEHDSNLQGAGGYFDKSTGSIVLPLGSNGSLIHESMHANDPDDNPKIMTTQKAESFINLEIKKNALLLDANWGIHWDQPEMYATQGQLIASLQQNNRPLTPKEFAIVTLPSGSRYSDHIFENALNCPALEKLNTNMTTSANNYTEFFENNKDDIEQAIKENPLLAVVIDEINQNSEEYNKEFGTQVEPQAGFTGYLNSYIITRLEDTAESILISKILKGDPQTITVLDQNLKEKTEKVIKTINYTNSEFFAWSLTETKSGSYQFTEPESNPSLSYLKFVKDLTEQESQNR